MKQIKLHYFKYRDHDYLLVDCRLYMDSFNKKDEYENIVDLPKESDDNNLEILENQNGYLADVMKDIWQGYLQKELFSKWIESDKIEHLEEKKRIL